MSRAQAAIELTLIASLMLMVLFLLFEFGETKIIESASVLQVSEARNTVDRLAKAAIEVRNEGVGARRKIYVTIPDRVNPDRILIDNCTITIGVYVKDGTTDISARVSFPVVKGGYFPTTAGSYWVWVINKQGYVQIGSALEVEPLQVYSELFPNNSTNADITFTNHGTSPINVSLALIWADSEVGVEINDTTDLSFILLPDTSNAQKINLDANAYANASRGLHNGYLSATTNISESELIPIMIDIVAPPPTAGGVSYLTIDTYNDSAYANATAVFPVTQTLYYRVRSYNSTDGLVNSTVTVRIHDPLLTLLYQQTSAPSTGPGVYNGSYTIPYSLPGLWKITAYDIGGASIAMYFTTIATPDNTPPTYSLNSTNSTVAGTSVQHRLKWNDDFQLSGYIFQFCNGTINSGCTPSVWLSGWTYRKSHNITNATGADVNYQVKIIIKNTTSTDSGDTVYIDNKARSDFGDVRFTNSTGGLLDYWMENVTNSINATFWVEINGNLTSTNQTIYIYYGNSSATTTSNGTNTFTFFDDFDGSSLDSNKWTNTTSGSATITISDSMLIMNKTTSHGQASIWSKTTITSARMKINLRYSLEGTNWNTDYLWGFMNDNTTLGAYLGLSGANGSIWNPDAGGYYGPTYDQFSYSNGTVVNTQVSFAAVNTWRTYEQLLKSGTTIVEGYEGNMPENTFTTGIPTDTMYENIAMGENTGSPTYAYGLNVSWVFLSKYVSPEPSHGSWGGEEQLQLTANWVNDTWTAFTSGMCSTPYTECWSNVTKVVNSTFGATIEWCVYANDTSNNWNGTSCNNPFTYNTTSPIPTVIGTTDSIALYSNQRAICRDGLNYIHAVWLYNSTTVAYAKSTDNGATFTNSLTAVNTVGTKNTPSISCNGNNITVAYVNGTANLAVFNSGNNGATFTDISPTSATVGNTVYEVNVERRGQKIYLVYGNASTPSKKSSIIFLNSTDAGSTWGTKTEVLAGWYASNSDFAEYLHPSLAVNGTGGTADILHVLVHEDGKDVGDSYVDIFYINSLNSGSSWGNAATILFDITNQMYYPSITFSGINLFGTFYRNDDTVWFANSTNNGASWTAAYQISVGTNATLYPSVSLNSTNPIVFWQNNTANQNIQYKSYSGSAWNDVQNITTDNKNNTYVNSKWDYSGNCIEFVYMNGTSSPYNIIYNRIGTCTSP